MLEKLQFYIDGQWVDPVEPRTLDVVNPATEAVYGRISIGSAADVDAAVAAASRERPGVWPSMPRQPVVPGILAPPSKR